jgi:predicted PurR-regulated permease PerM
LALSLWECQRLGGDDTALALAHGECQRPGRMVPFPGVVEVRRNQPQGPPPSVVLRTCLVVLGVVVAVLLIYALRKPLTYLFIAIFLAIALARPVAFFERRMHRRGLAIATVYLMLIGFPIALGSLLIPPIVTSLSDFAGNVPTYVKDVQNFVNKNDQLRKINNNYNVTKKLEEQAGKLPAKVGEAAGTLGKIGAALVGGAFATVTILILTAFLLGSGSRWYEAFIRMQPEDRRDRLRRVLEQTAGAISGYVAGALVQATVAGVTALILLSILGVPFAAALALIMGIFDLIPVIGATIGAVLIGVVTLFADFPTATIVWIVYSIVYQQFENSVIQPQIQKRTVDVNGFVIVVAVLFGSTLFGVLGALTAIPVAASIQIAIREYWEYRAEQRVADSATTSTG